MTEFAWNGLRVVVNEHRAEAFGRPTLGTVAFVNSHLGTTTSVYA